MKVPSIFIYCMLLEYVQIIQSYVLFLLVLFDTLRFISIVWFTMTNSG